MNKKSNNSKSTSTKKKESSTTRKNAQIKTNKTEIILISQPLLENNTSVSIPLVSEVELKQIKSAVVVQTQWRRFRAQKMLEKLRAEKKLMEREDGKSRRGGLFAHGQTRT